MMNKNLSVLLLLVTAVSAGGCAPADHSFEDEGAFDPVEPINRAVYGFNKKADFFLLRPAAKTYDNFTGPFEKNLAENFFSNLGEPKNVLNHILQKRGDDAARSAARFVFNSVFGIGGLADIANSMGVKERETGFGQTIRAYAGDRGAYIVLPFLGPSSVADAPGAAADGFLAPHAYLSADSARAGIAATEAVHIRAGLLDDEYLLESALDEYSYVRDFAEELRRRDTPSDVWGEPDNVWGK
ncbi:MAG: MlaA family lipoprotein [Gammaproteobacteria bacterium]